MLRAYRRERKRFEGRSRLPPEKPEEGGGFPGEELRGVVGHELQQRVARRVVGDVLLVGDAAGYVDPLTGEGVALGLATARAAISCLVEDDPGAYEARYRRLARRYFALTSALLAVTRRRRLHRPLLRLARAWPAAFDAALGMLGHVPHEDDAGAPSAWPRDDVTIGLDRLL